MREILFRGAQKVDGSKSLYWHEGSLVIEKDDYTGDVEYYIQNESGNFLVIPKTVGQYIGSTDRHGNKIFEGNIVKLILDNGEIRLFKVSIKKVKRRVINHPNFRDGSSYVEITGVVFEWKGYQLFPCIDENGIVDYSKMEIVGNTHDNPELLNLSEFPNS